MYKWKEGKESVDGWVDGWIDEWVGRQIDG